MRARVKMNRLKGNGGATKRFFICACATGGEIEQPQDGCAPGVFVSGWAAEDIVGGNTTLAIRRTSQRNQRPLARDSITHLNSIAYCPDVWIRSEERRVGKECRSR